MLSISLMPCGAHLHAWPFPSVLGRGESQKQLRLRFLLVNEPERCQTRGAHGGPGVQMDRTQRFKWLLEK